MLIWLLNVSPKLGNPNLTAPLNVPASPLNWLESVLFAINSLILKYSFSSLLLITVFSGRVTFAEKPELIGMLIVQLLVTVILLVFSGVAFLGNSKSPAPNSGSSILVVTFVISSSAYQGSKDIFPLTLLLISKKLEVPQ